MYDCDTLRGQYVVCNISTRLQHERHDVGRGRTHYIPRRRLAEPEPIVRQERARIALLRASKQLMEYHIIVSAGANHMHIIVPYTRATTAVIVAQSRPIYVVTAVSQYTVELCCVIHQAKPELTVHTPFSEP